MLANKVRNTGRDTFYKTFYRLAYLSNRPDKRNMDVERGFLTATDGAIAEKAVTKRREPQKRIYRLEPIYSSKSNLKLKINLGYKYYRDR
ncbi:hypothetical protein A7D23_09915 [Dehalobacter sp. TeCB1]|nr:hypothetical protein A7D23_09915 [Dehalobacter sp. TeCB1]